MCVCDFVCECVFVVSVSDRKHFFYCVLITESFSRKRLSREGRRGGRWEGGGSGDGGGGKDAEDGITREGGLDT